MSTDDRLTRFGQPQRFALSQVQGDERSLKSTSNTNDTLSCHYEEIEDFRRNPMTRFSLALWERVGVRGFTLAETLLTLGIIGVVAALVIPQLKQTIDNRELVSKYLKTNNVISKAYKETEAVSTIQLYSQSPDKFKELLESHLKILSSDCIQNVCLTDGSSYSYECDETKCTGIIIDTNGDKKPNSAGKDRYRMLVTNKGLIAQGESEYCGTIDGGLDCGKYILTYHKLFDGLINNCTAYDNGQCSQCENGYQNNGNSCKDIRENTCATYSGTTCTKCTSGQYLTVDNYCEPITIENCVDADVTGKCTSCESGYILNFNSSCTMPKIVGNTKIAILGYATQDDAYNICQKAGLKLPDEQTLVELYRSKSTYQDQLPDGDWYWASDKDSNGSPRVVNFAYGYRNSLSDFPGHDGKFNTFCVSE